MNFAAMTFWFRIFKTDILILNFDILVLKVSRLYLLHLYQVSESDQFSNLLPNSHPITTKSRRFSTDDQKFIADETEKLHSEAIIELGSGTWRAQLAVVKDSTDRHRKRLCMDYSNTINLFTQLNTYPSLKIDEIINDLSTCSMFSTFDLKCAYRQIPIKKKGKICTGFEKK